MGSNPTVSAIRCCVCLLLSEHSIFCKLMSSIVIVVRRSIIQTYPMMIRFRVIAAAGREPYIPAEQAKVVLVLCQSIAEAA